MIFIGLLSGTSMDNIDLGLFEITAVNKLKTLAVYAHPIPADFKAECLALTTGNGDCNLSTIGCLNIYAAKIFASAVNSFIEQHNLVRNHITGIGFCGQNIWHQPNLENGFSWQIGDPSTLAVLTQLNVYTSFRQKDIALGRQGAPLAPYFHLAYFQHPQQNRVIINIGGISNLSIIDSNATIAKGFDSGPGNCLLDEFTLKHFNLPYDQDGQLARQGQVQPELLTLLLADDYFQRPLPKSSGREHFNLSWLEKKLAQLDKKFTTYDLLATLVELTTASISLALIEHNCAHYHLYLCGGGAQNPLILEKLAQHHTVSTTAELGLAPDWVEAALFAWFGYMTAQQNPLVPCGALYLKY